MGHGLAGSWTDSNGKDWGYLIDVIYGDGEEAAKEFIEVVREGKGTGSPSGRNSPELPRAGSGFYEPDGYWSDDLRWEGLHRQHRPSRRT